MNFHHEEHNVFKIRQKREIWLPVAGLYRVLTSRTHSLFVECMWISGGM